DASELMGRTECNRVVNFPTPQGVDSAALIGQMLDVRITEAMTYTLRGQALIEEHA
ncbi:MAG: TRAM domain-containing protein, partial [Comamonadaceae bacterium]|nr:TRAM domain-containing protein [Comamonadaceae bacterium]